MRLQQSRWGGLDGSVSQGGSGGSVDQGGLGGSGGLDGPGVPGGPSGLCDLVSPVGPVDPGVQVKTSQESLERQLTLPWPSLIFPTRSWIHPNRGPDRLN